VRQADLAQVSRKMRKAQATEARADKDGMDPEALALLTSDLKQDRSERTLDEAAVQVGALVPTCRARMPKPLAVRRAACAHAAASSLAASRASSV
jgi:hypothetical protein